MCAVGFHTLKEIRVLVLPFCGVITEKNFFFPTTFNMATGGAETAMGSRVAKLEGATA